jgi:hypothetical protein
MAFRHALLAATIAGVLAAATASAQTPAPAAAPASGQGDERRPTADTDRTESTGDFNLAGDVSASALIGAKIRNESKETVGTVEDLFVDDRGAITTVVVSVGGFLGVGARSVGVKWSDVRRSRDGNDVVLVTTLGKDELKALPPYVAQLRKPVAKEQAAAPH